MAVRDWLDGMGWGEVISLGLLLNEDLFSGQLIPWLCASLDTPPAALLWAHPYNQALYF